MVLGQDYINYIKDDINKNMDNQSELVKELKSEFKTYDEMLQVALFFMRESKRRYITIIQLQSLLNKKGITNEEIRKFISEGFDEGAMSLLEHRDRVKNGLKIAYKHHATVEECVRLMSLYNNIDKVAETLGVSRSTVWRRLKSAKQ